MAALKVKDITACTINKLRSSVTEGWTYLLFSTGTVFGSIKDNQNTFSDADSTETAEDLKITISKNNEDINIQYKDTLSITYIAADDSSKNLTIYFPRLLQGVTLYVDDQGITYYDAGLTQPAIWKEAYTPEESSWNENN